MTQAVILAGGKGTRLAERLNGLPKPLIGVCGRPLLDRQLDLLHQAGVTEAVVLVNHAADQIEDFIAKRHAGPTVRLIDDGEPRGTAGAVLACMDVLENEFAIVYGDTLFDIDVQRMIDKHRVMGADVTLFLHPNDHPADSDLVEIDGDGWVTAFHGYPHPPQRDFRNLVNAAFYVVNRSSLEPWVDQSPPLDFGKDLFPRMLKAGARIFGYVSYEYIKDLGTPKRLDKVERHLSTGVVERARRHHAQKAIFVDRDGTLNQLQGFLKSADQMALIPGAGRAVARFNEAEYRVVLITNQPVLARGEADFDDMARIHARLETLLGREGGYLDAIYLCPHHPDAGFSGEVAELKIVCNCRKPAVGMFNQAVADLNIDVASSWMVGDSSADILASEVIGATSILVSTGEGGRDGKWAATADLTADDIGGAARLIVDVVPAFERELGAFAAALTPGALVLVAGLARSGKSTAGTALRRVLSARGMASTIVHADDWIKSHDEREAGLLGRYQMHVLEACLTDWLDGSEAVFDAPVYDRIHRKSRKDRQVHLGADEIVILEGISALLPDWRTDRPVARIWVECDAEARALRVEADLVRRGLATVENVYEIRTDRDADEVNVVLQAKASADTVINTDKLMQSGL